MLRCTTLSSHSSGRIIPYQQQLKAMLRISLAVCDHQGYYSSNGQSDQQSRLRTKKWGIDYKGNAKEIQSNWIPNTKNFQAKPPPQDCFTTIPGCQRCEAASGGPVCWQCLFNFKQTSFVLSQTLGFPKGFCGEAAAEEQQVYGHLHTTIMLGKCFGHTNHMCGCKHTRQQPCSRSWCCSPVVLLSCCLASHQSGFCKV
jgi:hypothetical protein